jgi:hypothetical protein
MKLVSLYQMPQDIGNPDLTLLHRQVLYFHYGPRSRRVRAGFRFNGVVAIQIRSDTCIERWQDDTYYELAEVLDAPWKDHVLDAAVEGYSWYRDVKHHYAISDDSNCYEFIADSWELLPEEEWQETP